MASNVAISFNTVIIDERFRFTYARLRAGRCNERDIKKSKDTRFVVTLNVEGLASF